MPTRPVPPFVVCAALALALAACGDGAADGSGDDDDDVARDAGPADDVRGPTIPWLDEGRPPIAAANIPWIEAGAPPIAAPDIPWRAAGSPVVASCPEGWRETRDPDAGSVCEPYPATGVADCAIDEAHFPGEADCVTVGAACPAGNWPSVADVPGETTLVYVRADAVGGTGTRDEPFGSVAEAFEGIASGTLVVLSSGEYALPSMPSGVSLRGKCVAQTTVRNQSPSQFAAVLVEGGAATVENLRVAPSFVAGVLVTGGSTALTLDGVVIDEPWVAGISARGGQVEARSVVVRDTHAVTFMGQPVGYGVLAGEGGELDASRLVVSGIEAIGIQVTGSTTRFAIEDLLVEDGQLFDGERGWGLLVDTGAEGTIERAVFDHNVEYSVQVVGSGSSLELTDAVVRRTQPGGDSTDFGVGLSAAAGGRLEGTRILLEHNHTHGAFVVAAELVLRDLVARDNGSMEPTPWVGEAVSVDGADATATIERAALVRTVRQALLAENGAALSSTDVLIRGLPDDVEGDLDRGALVLSGAELSLRRAIVERARGFGVLALREGTTATLEDVIVRGTRPTPIGHGGVGFRSTDGAAGTLRRTVFEDNHESGVCVSDGRLDATDLVVRGTVQGSVDGCFRVDAEDPPGAFALSFARDATGRVERALLEDNENHAFYAQGESVAVELHDVAIRGTRPGGDGRLPSFGMRWAKGSSVDAERVLVDGNVHTGIGIGGDDDALTEAVFRDLVVRDTTAWEGEPVSGFGLWASRRVSLEIERGVVARCEVGGMALTGPNLSATVRDVAIEDVLGMRDGRGGYGMSMYGGGMLTLERVAIERAHRIGALVATGSDATLRTTFLATDVSVRGTRALDQPGVEDPSNRNTRGWGLVAEDAVDVTLERILVENNREIGIGTSANRAEGMDVTAALVASHVLVRNTLPPACGSDCNDRPPGVGLATYRSGQTRLERFAIEASAFCGVQVAADGQVDLSNGRVEGHPVAVCLASADFDVSRLQERVSYVNNDGSIETVAVAIPALPDLLDELPPIDADVAEATD